MSEQINRMTQLGLKSLGIEVPAETRFVAVSASDA